MALSPRSQRLKEEAQALHKAAQLQPLYIVDPDRKHLARVLGGAPARGQLGLACALNVLACAEPGIKLDEVKATHARWRIMSLAEFAGADCNPGPGMEALAASEKRCWQQTFAVTPGGALTLRPLLTRLAQLAQRLTFGKNGNKEAVMTLDKALRQVSKRNGAVGAPGVGGWVNGTLRPGTLRKGAPEPFLEFEVEAMPGSGSISTYQACPGVTFVTLGQPADIAKPRQQLLNTVLPDRREYLPEVWEQLDKALMDRALKEALAAVKQYKLEEAAARDEQAEQRRVQAGLPPTPAQKTSTAKAGASGGGGKKRGPQPQQLPLADGSDAGTGGSSSKKRTKKEPKPLPPVTKEGIERYTFTWDAAVHSVVEENKRRNTKEH